MVKWRKGDPLLITNEGLIWFIFSEHGEVEGWFFC